MGKALALLLVGLVLGLAAFLLELDGARGGASPAAGRVPNAPASVRTEGAGLARELALDSLRTAAPAPGSLPVLHAPAQQDPATTPAAEVEAERGGDDGMLRSWYFNGQLEYESGRTLAPNGVWLREGPWHAWHENGQLHERGAYHLGEETGFWEWWYENGNRMAVGQFEAGAREGFWRYWHEDGALMTECFYRAGKAHGDWKHFHPNGFKSAQGRFEDGELVGLWTVWRADGALNPDGTGLYASGEKIAE